MAEKKKVRGYIKLDRGIMDHWLWEDKPFSIGQAWLDLLLLANHKDVKQFRRGTLETFERGTVVTSYDILAKRWGWGRKKVIHFIDVLIEDGMVVKKGTTKGTALSLVNYEKFQGQGAAEGTAKGTAEGTSEELQRNYGGTTEELQRNCRGDTNKNVNNDKDTIKNDKNERGQSPAPAVSTPPSLEEVKLYAQVTGAVSDPETFFRYYDERGWKRTRGLPIDNWRKTFDTWEAREKKERAEQGDRGDRGRGSGSGTSRPARPNSFTNFEQRNVDYGALEDALVRKGMGIESEEDKALIARFTL